jgi:CDP-L-myo-inositol myo-inositolphosphotransferase
MSKPQDGFVSRFLNRPISRRVTRVLLKFPISPNAFTIGAFVLPLIASAFLVRGSYLSLVIGAALFHIHSVVDGCDGEIARAKGMQSEFGARLDDVCDLLSSVLYAIGLGIGIGRSIEGVICASAILLNELLLLIGEQTAPAQPAELDESFYSRHQVMIGRSGLVRFAHVFWWIGQLTKRDVAIFVFLLLALVNLAPWILHLWTAFSVASLIFSSFALARTARAGS